MNDVITIGDQIRLHDGTTATIRSIERTTGLYVISGHPTRVLLNRHEFRPIKWLGDVVGNTVISVCAKNGSEEIAA